MLRGKTIVLGVCGGIAAYKAASLCSRLTQEGADVRVIMTESAQKFIAPLTFQALSRNDVYMDTFEERVSAKIAHIDLADSADLIVIAPASANTIGKMAHGLADDMLSTTLLAATCPVMIAPAMNVHMYGHPAVTCNLETLRKRGAMVVEPNEGQLACGYVGKGRLAEPEEIAERIRAFFAEKQLLQGVRMLVTAGATAERIDPVRYLTNDSSGKMGFAIASVAASLGADVTVVAGHVSEPLPDGVHVVRVESAQQMMEAVLSRYDENDWVIKAAAVADYRPSQTFDKKMKKSESSLTLELVRNPDILRALGERKTRQLLIGFAAETGDPTQEAMRKLKDKNCDLLVANDVTLPDAGFGKSTNVVSVFDAGGLVEALPAMAKPEVAKRLLLLALDRWKRREAAHK